MIADYWVVRRKQLSLEDLYDEQRHLRPVERAGARRDSRPAALALVGLVVPALRPLYDYAWFVGFGVAFASYVDADAGWRPALSPHAPPPES